MKKFLLTLTALVAMTAGSVAQACDGFYAGAFGGANWVTDTVSHVDFDFDTGYTGALSAGYGWDNGCRVEGEYSYRHNDLDHVKFLGQKFPVKGSTQSHSYMVNGFYDYSIDNCLITPFVGAGIGYANQSAVFFDKNSVESGHARGFAYQVIVGAAYPIADKIDLSAEYRLHKGQMKAFDHTVGIGLKYYF